MARHTAQAVRNVFEDRELAEWGKLALDYSRGSASDEEIAAVVDSPRYRELKRLTENLNTSNETNDIYIVVYDTDVAKGYTPEAHDEGKWNPFVYIMDTYYLPDLQYPMGSASAASPDMLGLLNRCWETGEDPTETIITYWKKGGLYILTGMHVITYEGKTVAFIGVEMPLPTLEHDFKDFILTIIVVDMIVMLLLLIFTLTILIWTIIEPIRAVTDEAQRFVADNTEVSDRLLKIKTHDEIQTLSESLLSLEYGVKDYIENITKFTEEKGRVSAELNVATRIQYDLMPTDFPKRDDMEIYASMTPAKEIGGDFYDFFFIDDDHLAVVMADVSGKGIPAALVMVVTKTLIADRARLDVTPARILEEVNNKLCGSNSSGMFVTLWLGIITLSTGEVNYANAGHEYPAIRRKNGVYELITASHLPPIATMENMEYEDKKLTLEKGDGLFLYTDGIPEAKSPDGKRFGTDKMVEILNRDSILSPEKLVKDIKREVDEFAGGNDPFDDVTMMCFMRK